MKPHILWLLPLLLACGTNGGNEVTNTTDTALKSSGSYAANMAAAPLPALPACYQLVTSKDTTVLRLRSQGADGEIGGTLDHRAGPKESHSGTFFGRMAGDTLVANYSYLQKGKRKVRQLAFLRRGDAWLQGSGPSAERSGIRQFTDHQKLEFNSEAFQRGNCQ